MAGWSRTLIGLLTLALMAVGGWYVVDLLKKGGSDGNEIRLVLRFSDAHGVPVGGAVRHKGVRVGEVLKVDISPDDSGVIMAVSMATKFQHTLRRNSRFWIVRPRFGGLTQGVTGLDTLIKDPYVEFDTPDLSMPVLDTGEVVFGLNVPPSVVDSQLYRKEKSRHSSVSFKVRLAEAQGLREGAPVLYRDVPVGTVRSVDLSPDGRAVEVDVLLHGRYRETARTDTHFWVAKPDVEVGFHWPSLVNVRDISKILTGAALTYVTPTESQGRILKNGDVIEGTDDPPKDMEDFQGPLMTIDPQDERKWVESMGGRFVLGEVWLSFTENDFFGDQDGFYQGTGLLIPGPEGRILVLTARTLADGSYSSSDLIGDPDIEGTDLKVHIGNRSIHEARLLWIDPDGRDLALLELTGEGLPEPGPAPVFTGEEAMDDYLMLIAFREGESGMIRSQPIPANKVLDPGKRSRGFHPDLRLDAREWYGALLVNRGGSVIGVLGRAEALSDRAALAVLHEIPALEKGE